MAQPQDQFKFPENAYRELKPGEEYVPMIPPNVRVPELTTRALIFGLVMNIIFSVAATFLALKAGQGIETAIPVSILAVGLSGFLVQMGRRMSTILENVYVLAFSTTSGYVAGGTCFTMPAIYILKLNEPDALNIGNLSLFLQIALVPFLGSILGVIFLIPFRRYFVKQMHGKLPFPEATATNEILVTGASGSTQQAWVLIYSFVLAFIYNFLSAGMRLFSHVFTTGMAKLEPVAQGSVSAPAVPTQFFETLTHKIKAVFFMGTGAYYLGLGFIIGLRYASIICAGSFLSWFVIIPLLAHLDLDTLRGLNSACVAYNGPAEDAPRLQLPGNVAALLDEFAAGQPSEAVAPPREDLQAAHAELRAAFAAQQCELTEEATVSTRTYGQHWSIAQKPDVYNLKLNEEQGVITVHKGKAEATLFSLPIAWAERLSEFDHKAKLRKQIGDAFADAGQPFAKEAVGITVATPGLAWKIKDKNRAYELRRSPDTGQIAVFANTASAVDIFGQVPKNIGIGAIFTAGLLSILKMGGVIVTALRQALGSLFRRQEELGSRLHTDEDISYPTMTLLGILAIIVMVLFFRFSVLHGMENANWLTVVSVLVILVIAFLFTTVSAWAIAMISVTPISGMTVTTIIITAVLLGAAGLGRGDRGMLATLLVGGVVCTALSMAGGLVTNFKLGYWLGASPKRIAWNAVVGSLIASIFVCGTIMVLAYKPGYTGEGALPAPQANMMASALESFLGTGEVPWLLYGVGVVVALLIQLLGISALAFGLGMYLPMEINTPILAGAFVAWLVKKSTRSEPLAKARSNKGILIASGLIAGAAIVEVLVNFTAALDDLALGQTAIVAGEEKTVGVIMPFLDVSGRLLAANTDPQGLARFENWLGLIMFLALCVFVYLDCLRAKPSADAPSLAGH
ncbi:MAG TPA: OPT/YSL family transporter [Phycisphaerae bacterium]|nr:OPT/YSL family transporter [Phycisphaerae bacterium]HNU46547.1 OPT/YSL family transporter [Phycisphaerae bacterium]